MKFCKIITALLICISNIAFAGFSSDITATRSVHESNIEKKLDTDKDTRVGIGLFDEVYIQPSKKSKGHYQVLDVNFAHKGSGKILESFVDARAGGALNAPSSYNYIYIPEIYAGSVDYFLVDSKISFGRKILPWNETDHHWQLGVFQPRYRWNYFNPIEQGLTGLIIEHERGDYGINVVASPLYLPEQGPNFDLKDGSFESEALYFKAPAPNVGLFGQNTKVRYSINQPNISDIVLNPGFATSVRLGGNHGLRSRISYAYKPMSQIMMGIDGYLSLQSFEANVTANPRVVYHHVGSLDFGYYTKSISGWTSIMREWTESDKTPPTWTIQQASTATVAAIGIDTDVMKISTRPSRAGMSFLSRFGGDADDSGPFATKGQPIFESRYPYKNALSMTFQTPLPGKVGEKFDLNNRFIYEVNNQSTAYLARFGYNIRKNFNVHLGGEILVSNVDTPTEGFKSDMISRNKGNDRVFGGMSYVF